MPISEKLSDLSGTYGVTEGHTLRLCESHSGSMRTRQQGQTLVFPQIVYYSKVVQQFATKGISFTPASLKECEIEWDTQCQKCFKEIK